MEERTPYIGSGLLWESGYIESFTGKLRDDLLDRGTFSTLLVVKVLTEQYRQTCNTIRPHISLDYSSAVPETALPQDPVLSLPGMI